MALPGEPVAIPGEQPSGRGTPPRGWGVWAVGVRPPESSACSQGLSASVLWWTPGPPTPPRAHQATANTGDFGGVKAQILVLRHTNGNRFKIA